MEGRKRIYRGWEGRKEGREEEKNEREELEIEKQVEIDGKPLGSCTHPMNTEAAVGIQFSLNSKS